MIRLYRWFQEHASLFRRTVWEQDGSRTMRREVTVEKEERRLLVRSSVSQDLDVCPFCGQKLPEKTGGNRQTKPGNDVRLGPSGR